MKPISTAVSISRNRLVAATLSFEYERSKSSIKPELDIVRFIQVKM